MPHLLDRRLAEWKRRRRLARVLKRLWPLCAVALCLGAGVVVAIRAALPELATWAWALLPAALCLSLALVPFGSGPPDAPHALAGHLDGALGAEGLLMALAAQPAAERDEDWVARLRGPLERATPPALAWSGAWPALAGLVALGVALALPQREADPTRTRPPVATHFEPTLERLAALTEAGVLPAVEEQELEAQLQRLMAEAGRTGMTQSAWDGLDRVDARLAEDLALASRRLAEALVDARTAASLPADGLPPETRPEEESNDRSKPPERDRLRKPPETGPSGAAARAEAARRLLERLTREGRDPGLEKLAKSLGELAKQAPGLMERLSPEAEAALRKLLESAGAREALEALAKAGLGAEPGQAGGPPLDAEAVARILEELEKALVEGRVRLGQAGADGPALDLMIAQLEALAAGAGSGGVSRGPGHAQLTRDGTPPVEVGARERLPEGAVVNADGSVKLAESVRAPELDDAALRALARGITLGHDPSHADARRVEIAPRHRGAVGRYFKTQEAP